MLRYFVLSVFLLAIGCSNEKEAEPYQVERDQLIQSLFAHVDSNNISAIDKDLNRLHYIIKHDAFLEGLAKRSKINNYLIKADKALKLNDLNTAAVYITQSGNGVLVEQIESLQVIKSYLQEKPYRQSRDYFKALETIADLKLPKKEFAVFHTFLARERKQAEILKQQEYQKALTKMVNIFSKMIIASSKYMNVVEVVVKDKKFTAVDVNAIVRDIKEFSPQLDVIVLNDFVDEINKAKFSYAERLQKINNDFKKGADETGLTELKALLKSQRRTSQKLQMYLISRSKKLRFFLDDQTFNLDIVIDKYYKQKELESQKLNESTSDEVDVKDIEPKQEREITNEF